MMRKGSKETNHLLNKSSKEADMILYEYFKNNRYPKKSEKQRLAEKTNVPVQYVVNFFYNARSRIRRLEKQEANGRKKKGEGLYSEFKISPIDRTCSEYSDLPMHSQRIPKFRGFQNNLYISEPKIEAFLLVDDNNENIKNSEFSECDDNMYFKNSNGI